MSKVICIDDSNRPSDIPTSKWVKKGEEYTVIEIIKCNTQGGLIGLKLAEIDLSGYEPYTCFAANRFRIPAPEEKIEEVEELVVC